MSILIQIQLNRLHEVFTTIEKYFLHLDADIQNRELGGLGIYLTKKYAKESWSEPYFDTFKDIEYKDTTRIFKENEKLFFYTDGVNEAYSRDDEQFGEKRLENILFQSISFSAKESIEEVLEALSLFCKGSPQSDDITMLCIKHSLNEKKSIKETS